MNKQSIMDFKDITEFKEWLKSNHETSNGEKLFIYKKGYHHLGISYEEAVLAALCYGWIDSTVHRHNDEKFIQNYSPRRKNSNWSISNIKRMKLLIAEEEMTEYGLKFFDLNLLDQLDELIEKDKAYKNGTITMLPFLQEILIDSNAIEKVSPPKSPICAYELKNYLFTAKSM